MYNNRARHSGQRPSVTAGNALCVSRCTQEGDGEGRGVGGCAAAVWEWEVRCCGGKDEGEGGGGYSSTR